MANDNLQYKDGFISIEDISKMEIAFREKYLSFFQKDEDIVFEGYIQNDHLYLTAILKNFEETFYYPFETYIKLSKDLKKEEAQNVLLDFIDTYFYDYFNMDKNIFVPIDWKSYNFKDYNIFSKGQVVNKKIENMADSILKENAYETDGKKLKEDI